MLNPVWKNPLLLTRGGIARCTFGTTLEVHKSGRNVMEMQDEKALLAAFRVMEPPVVLVSLARRVGGGNLTTAAQKKFLESCLNDEMCRKYPPARIYLRRTLKQIILAAENDKEEVLDGLYELHADYLLPSEVSESAPKCYKTYTYCLPAKARAYLSGKGGAKKVSNSAEMLITVRVSLNLLEGDTGCCVWPASLFLSEFLLSNPEVLFGQNCLELGSGTGMVGVLLARLAACKIVLTDGSLVTLANLKHTLEVNGVQFQGLEGPNHKQGSHSASTMSVHQSQGLQLELESRHLKHIYLFYLHIVECQQLLWEELSGTDLQRLSANVILGADLIYDTTYIPYLVRVLTSLLSVGHSKQNNGLKDNNASHDNASEPASPEARLSSHRGTYRDSQAPKTRRQLTDMGVHEFPVAYIASAVRNPETLMLFLETTNRAGLEIMDISESMRPSRCFPEISGFDRSKIVIHRVRAFRE